MLEEYDHSAMGGDLSEPKLKLFGPNFKNRNNITTEEAIAKITHELTVDSAYRNVWKANIAMAFKDEIANTPAVGYDAQDEEESKLLHEVANAAAERFLQILCSL